MHKISEQNMILSLSKARSSSKHNITNATSINLGGDSVE
jgi:hypothetical protein